MAKRLSTTPLIDVNADIRDCTFGVYTEVGPRTTLLQVALGDYSYVVNDSDIAYATIGNFCPIAAMRRINPGNHPMQRASQSYAAAGIAGFPGAADPGFSRQIRTPARPRLMDWMALSYRASKPAAGRLREG